MLIIGWISWILAGFLPIIASFTMDVIIKEYIMFINSIAFSLGIFFIFLSIVSYFYELSGKFIFTTCMLIISLPTIVLIVSNFILAKTMAFALGFGSFGVMLVTLRINRRKVRNLIGKSIGWFYLGLIGFVGYLINSGILLFTVKDYSFGLFDSTNDIAVMINYSMSIFLTVLIIVIFIHFERSITRNEMQSLKDNYSHDLGNILQTIMFALGLIEFNDNLEPKEQNYLNIIKSNSNDASVLIKEIRKL
jgi:signal transduction histidine kinase